MTTYLYRDKLTRRELVPAIGAGMGAGVAVALAVGYFTQLMLRKRELASGSPERAIEAEARLVGKGSV